ncbi:MAG: hypothetical protein FVQ81_17790 [Candidatus Glassbacteria bacterium]|nr:hypothetical protein [Candidatus Glassbacteria bacterium]
MNTIQATASFQPSSIPAPRGYNTQGLATAHQWLRSAMTSVRESLARHADRTEEKRRLRAIKQYHRNRARLPSAGFRFDPRSDDFFSRLDS